MITKEQAIEKREGGFYKYNLFYHTDLKNKDGSKLRVRRNGKTKIWKSARNSHKFKIPVKHGLYNYGYITESNSKEWTVEEYDY